MTGEIIYATIFMVCFVLIGGVVMYLSRTIDAGEARFDADGKVIKDKPEQTGPARPAQRLEEETGKNDE
ncbi:MAG: hypothetical protein SXU28_11250 [Pseudomonadota bacterium]|nr:hypothetical protein [Pseudomonadota bacterium]